MTIKTIEDVVRSSLSDAGLTPAQVTAITRAICAAIEEYHRQRQQEPR